MTDPKVAEILDVILSVQNPYPEDVFPMTEEQYIKAIPNEDQRTAISGLLMRKGWNVFRKQLIDALREKGIQIKVIYDV